MDILSFLQSHDIAYEACEHPAVFTCEESSRIVPPLPGRHTKNLFLRDKKGTRHFLVSVDCGKTVDLKALAPLLGARGGLGFASPERLRTYLGVEPGSVTILGLITDEACAVEVVLDRELWEAPFLQCHPLRNTATLVIPHDGIEKFLKTTKHEWKVVEVPGR